MTFAVITPGLIVGSLADQVKFWPRDAVCRAVDSRLFSGGARWCGTGPGWTSARCRRCIGGLLINKGALDFARGHRGASTPGIARLVGSIFLGRSALAGEGSDNPHSADHDHDRRLVAVGVGWFGFNSGSAPGSTSAACWPSSAPLSPLRRR